VWIVAFAIGLVHLTSAQAHGPCRVSVTVVGCLQPSSGGPGTRVTIVGTTAYKVVWNENVVYDSELHFHRGAKTVQLLRLSHGERNVEFVVPRTPPGSYPVAIYDGAEDGQHYTWNVFKVNGSSSSSFWQRVAPWLALPAIALLGAMLLLGRGRIRSSLARRR
jgi:hypothetical protein